MPHLHRILQIAQQMEFHSAVFSVSRESLAGTDPVVHSGASAQHPRDTSRDAQEARDTFPQHRDVITLHHDAISRDSHGECKQAHQNQ